MPRDETAEAIASLGRLLVAEREMLRAGDLAGLAASAEEKARLVSALPGSAGPHREELAGLRALAETNARLLAAAVDAVAEVRQMLAQVRSGGLTFSTYDSRGRASAVQATANSALERRA